MQSRNLKKGVMDGIDIVKSQDAIRIMPWFTTVRIAVGGWEGSRKVIPCSFKEYGFNLTITAAQIGYSR